jgi:hypothetical protein
MLEHRRWVYDSGVILFLPTFSLAIAERILVDQRVQQRLRV